MYNKTPNAGGGFIRSRQLQSLYDILTQARKQSLIDDTHKQELRKIIKNKIKSNT